MVKKLAVVMDPISKISIDKDSTFALLLEAQRRGYELYYAEQADIFIQDGIPYGRMQPLHVQDNPNHWFELQQQYTFTLQTFDIILMRKDPPVDMEYWYTTYALELAEAAGTFVINKPQSLRDINEKHFISWFPSCCAPTLISRHSPLIRDFLTTHEKIVCKPLNDKSGTSVFLLEQHDLNVPVILETLTQQDTRTIMAQRFLPDIIHGDKRILLINGTPVPHALARIPAHGEFRGNLARGARGVGVDLSERDYWLCAQVGPVLREKGILFAGLDVIGDYLTEINVTSPTCIRQLDSLYSLNIAGQLFDAIENN